MLINNSYHSTTNLAVKLQDSLYKVLELFEDHQVSHLPVLSDKNKYLGLIAQKDVFEIYDESKNVGENNHPFLRLSVFKHTHIYDCISLFGKSKISLLPIIDKDEQYLGYILPLDILSLISDKSSIQKEGSTITLKVHNRDYSLNEISRILEADGFLITTLFLEYSEQENSTLVHLKINKEDISRAIKTLERFNFEISFIDEDNRTDIEEEDRYQFFQKYLNL